MTPHLHFLDLRGDIRPMTSPPTRVVLCLGNFDGVHIAHRALLQEGIRLTRRMNAAEAAEAPCLCGVFSFFRPSVDYMARAAEPAPVHLSSLSEKLRLFAKAGMDFACLCDFPAVRGLEPGDFTDLLKQACGVRGVVCGFNHRFGKNAQGDPRFLATQFSAENTVCMPEMKIDGLTVSSSRIRQCLLDGDAETACRLLGRPYAIESEVVRGKQLGRTIGFPTANQYFPAESLIPAHGVYAVLGHTPYGKFAGVANVGSHPTVDEHARVNCETYFLGLGEDLYGHRVKVEFLHHIRAERTFANLDELTAAIQRDSETAAAYVARWLDAQTAATD